MNELDFTSTDDPSSNYGNNHHLTSPSSPPSSPQSKGKFFRFLRQNNTSNHKVKLQSFGGSELPNIGTTSVIASTSTSTSTKHNHSKRNPSPFRPKQQRQPEQQRDCYQFSKRAITHIPTSEIRDKSESNQYTLDTNAKLQKNMIPSSSTFILLKLSKTVLLAYLNCIKSLIRNSLIQNLF